MPTRFDWDDANTEHIARHKITPDEAEQVISGDDALVVRIETKKGEVRSVCMGRTATGRYLAVVHTVRGARIRVVTAFPMNRSQRRLYEENKKSN
jgi:uncharacterized protein